MIRILLGEAIRKGKVTTYYKPSSSQHYRCPCKVTINTRHHHHQQQQQRHLCNNYNYSYYHSNKRRWNLDMTKSLTTVLSKHSHPLSSIHRYKSTLPSSSSSSSSPSSINNKYYNINDQSEIHRLQHLRNVGVFAHVDAGKTTVTERMLALAGIVQRAGSVDTGNTVTDYLPAERERGITIQSAAISFDWKWHNSKHCFNISDDDDEEGGISDGDDDEVTIQLIDTPGHVDFSVEVNRSVAVLDGAVLVIDAVAGVQAQTETVWRAMTNPNCSMNHHHTGLEQQQQQQQKQQNLNTTTKRNRSNHYTHEPLPCIAFVNKMDKEGCNFSYALSTLKHKLSHANPIAIQIPLFQLGNTKLSTSSDKIGANIIAVSTHDLSMNAIGHFVGVVDLIEMRAIIWPHVDSSNVSCVEECIPTVINLLNDVDKEIIDPESQVTKVALDARLDLLASLADVDEEMEEYYLMEEDPSNPSLRAALRRATLARKILPVMTGAALRGKGVEPLLDAVADFLPSPLERLPPSLIDQEVDLETQRKMKKKQTKVTNEIVSTKDKVPFGHPLHPSLLAFAFKVVHMKSKGSGDGRVVFVRVYSGKISTRDTLKVITPNVPGVVPEKPRTERVGGMLELSGGQFNNLQDGLSFSGNVCALVGLKTVVTGDTLLLASEHGLNNKKGKKVQTDDIYDMNIGENVFLAGVASPKPVLTVRVEAESAEQQAKLSNALQLLTAEDPSLHVEETDSVTLISGLGELHIEVIVDRLKREFGLPVWIGKPAVAYRETVDDLIETPGLVQYKRTIGAMNLQAAVHLQIEHINSPDARNSDSSSMILSDPIVTIGSKVREFLQLDEEAEEEELERSSEIAKALIAGCKGALMRGPLGSFGMANVKCHVIDVDADGGLQYLNATPGAIRAAASSILSSVLNENKSSCSVLEPAMSIEITAPTEMVGTILSDLTARRGTVGEVFMGDGDGTSLKIAKALIHGEVPLSEILGYAHTLRSITAGEGTFTAEYIGHSACDVTSTSFKIK